MRSLISAAFLLTASIAVMACGSDPEAAAADTSTFSGDTFTPITDTAAHPPEVPDPDCVPSKTCADYAGQCGSLLDDGCVGTIDCSNTCLSPMVCRPDATCGEALACVPSCTDRACGSDGCDGSCGTCLDTEACVEGTCIEFCTPDCDGKTCGDDGCGESCGTCGADENCEAGQCIGDCTPDCGAVVCGDDGCSGSCGECGDDQTCTAGACTDDCAPACDGKVCGTDGCGATCGTCTGDDVCTDGACVGVCVPNCGAAVCGDDGCDGSCGSCDSGQACTDGQCAAGPPAQLVINEVLADPAPGDTEGDANCDGVRDAAQDEFVEIVNIGGLPMDLTGVVLRDGVSVRHEFSGTLLAGQTLVLFSGGSPDFSGTSANTSAWCAALPASAEPTIVMTVSTAELGLNNGSDTVTIETAGGDVLATFAWGADAGTSSSSDESMVLSPELTGADVIFHTTAPATIGAQSPGRRADGSAL